MAIARLGATSLDCDDPRALAEFYAALTDGEIIFAADNFVAVRTPGGTITTQRVDNHQPPTWPAPGVAKQVHLEFGVTSLEEAVAAAEGI
ncbi:MAG: VOC family protein, partial [Frankiales bacterium]|nr:VOC family protein [Frankiales bacterium]